MASGYSDLSEIRKDRDAYGIQQKPPKINLLNERPRRESLVEQQLTSTLTRPSTSQFYNDNFVGQQQQVTANLLDQGPAFNYRSQQQQEQPILNRIVSYQKPSGSAGIPTHHDYNKNMVTQVLNSDDLAKTDVRTFVGPMGTTTVTNRVVKTTTTTTGRDSSNLNSNVATSSARTYVDLTQDLTDKEMKLKREIAYLNQKLSPWARPPQIREPRKEPSGRVSRNEQKWIKECPNETLSRSSSRASSTRSTVEADLKEKVDKLLHDVEEIESKPLKTRQILIESGASRQASKSVSPQPNVGDSVHTAIIRMPRGEVDNKSPLPFAYDNFSTLGVRGNIASVGAAPPDTPYPPIFPMIKRSPSPGGKPKRC